MKINNAFIKSALRNAESGGLKLENVSEFTDRSVPSDCCMNFAYNDDGPRSTRGSLVISGVKTVIRGLRIEGLVTVDLTVDDLELHECALLGGIKVETGAKNVKISSCDIFASGRVAVTICPESSVELTQCQIHDSLVGLSVSREFKMFSGVEEVAPATDSKPACILQKCEFHGNGTDLVVCMMVRSGDAPGGLTAVVYPSGVLGIHDINVDELTVDASISGRFEKPITFKNWPLDLERFRGRTTDIPRRGFRSNKRFCHITIVNDNIVVNEDPFEPARAARTRKKRDREFSLAEVHYSNILGIDPGSDESTVGSAFRRLALLHHPDKQGSDDNFISVKKARDELMKIIASRT